MQKSHLYTLYFCIIILFGCVFYLFSLKDQPSVVEYAREGLPRSATVIKAPDAVNPQVKIFELPEALNFAGEPVPIEQPDVLERFEREIYVNAYWHSNTLLLMKRAGKFLPAIEKVLSENGIPDDFKYVALIESGLMNAVSPAGAQGFWQFMEGTAKEKGLEVNKDVDERYHYVKATQAACKYLQNAYARFGNWTSVAASYNMGIAGLTRSKNEQKMPDFYNLLLNEETSRYIFRILAVKDIFENPRKYGFELQTEDLYTMPLMREIVVTKTIDNLADWAIRHNSNYKELKIYNPWLRTNKLTVSKNNSYHIVLPT